MKPGVWSDRSEGMKVGSDIFWKLRMEVGEKEDEKRGVAEGQGGGGI